MEAAPFGKKNYGQPDPIGSDRLEPLIFQPSTIGGASSYFPSRIVPKRHKESFKLPRADTNRRKAPTIKTGCNQLLLAEFIMATDRVNMQQRRPSSVHASRFFYVA